MVSICHVTWAAGRLLNFRLSFLIGILQWLIFDSMLHFSIYSSYKLYDLSFLFFVLIWSGLPKLVPKWPHVEELFVTPFRGGLDIGLSVFFNCVGGFEWSWLPATILGFLTLIILQLISLLPHSFSPSFVLLSSTSLINLQANELYPLCTGHRVLVVLAVPLGHHFSLFKVNAYCRTVISPMPWPVRTYSCSMSPNITKRQSLYRAALA